MWPILLVLLVRMAEKKVTQKIFEALSERTFQQNIDLKGISDWEIFLEPSHLLGRIKRGRARVSNRYHLCSLTAAITLDCSLKTTLFALLGDKVIMHLCTS